MSHPMQDRAGLLFRQLFRPQFRQLLAGFVLALGLALPAGKAQAQSASNGGVLYGKTIVSGTISCLACHGTPAEDPALVRGAAASDIKNAVMTQARMLTLNGALTDSNFNDLAAYIAQTLGVTPTYLMVGATPSVTVSASTLNFASQNLNTTSPTQTLTLGNAVGSSVALNITSIAVTTGADFAVAGGTCVAGGGVVAGGSCTIAISFKPSATGTRSGTLTISDNAQGGMTTVSLSGTGVNGSPALTLSPTALTFASTVGSASPPLRVTASNTGTGSMNFSSLSLGGAQASDYSLAGSTTCKVGTPVAGGSSCVIDIVFTPGALGVRNGSLTVAANATGSPATVSLTGTATASPVPGIALNNTALNFGSQAAGTTSAPQTLTLTNSGGATLTLGSLSLSGNNATDFKLGGTCASGGSIAVGGSCTLSVTLAPVLLGNESATLSIASNAPTGTVSVALSGTSVATATPLVNLSVPALGFGTVTFGVPSAPRTVTLTNSGSASLSITSIVSTSPEFTVTYDCPSTLAVGATCTISVVYTPVAANASEAIVITTNAPSSPNSIDLTGLGTSATMPVLTWSPAATALNFASTVVGVSSASQSLTLTNQGPGAATLNSLGMAGTDAASFALASASTCTAGLTLQAYDACTVAVSFVPGSTGSKSAILQLATSGTSPGTVALTGTGASPSSASGLLTLSTTTLDFSSVPTLTGQSTVPLVLAVTNGSAAPVGVTSIAITGPFSITSGASPACASGAVALAPGGQCNVAVIYSPTMAGSSTGTLTITTPNQSLQVALKGQAGAANASLAWQNSATALMFSSTVVGSSSALQTLTLMNNSATTATLNSVSLTGSDVASFGITPASTCTANLSLNAGASCTVVLSFAPASAGAKTAALHVVSSATAPADVVLSGTGMAAAVGMLSISPTSIDFSATSVALGQLSVSQSLTLSNASTQAVGISQVSVSGPFMIASSTCPGASATLAVNGSCSIAVDFAPTRSGSASGSLTVTTSSAQTIVVTLTGLSNPPVNAAPVLAWQTGTSTSLNFGSIAVGSSSVPTTLMLTNQGPGAVMFTGLAPTGTDAASFSVTSGGSCSLSSALPQGGTCTVMVQFAPASAGNQSATLRVASNGTAPADLALAGLGTAAGGNTTLAANFLSLGFQAANATQSDPQTVTVTNTGSTALALSSIGTSGPFAIVSASSGGCSVPQSLAAGSSCQLSVVFSAPKNGGSSSGNLTIQSADGQTSTVALQGVAVVVNAGGSGNAGAGGAASPWWAGALALAVLALALQQRAERRTQPRSISRP